MPVKISRRIQVGSKEGLIDAVLKQVKIVDGQKKLSCAEAFELARQFQTKIVEIGRICNQHNVKVCKCQLGCFP